MSKDEALKLALEALENSYDYVAEEADRVERMYGNYPTRQGKVKGLQQDERKHMEAITAIKQALEQPVQEPVGEAKHMHGVSAAHTQAIFLKSEVPVGTKLYTTPTAAHRQQKPVAEITGMDEYGPMLGWYEHWTNFPVGTELYTIPPRAQRQWVGLTDERVRQLCGSVPSMKAAVREAEAELKEKNT